MILDLGSWIPVADRKINDDFDWLSVCLCVSMYLSGVIEVFQWRLLLLWIWLWITVTLTPLMRRTDRQMSATGPSSMIIRREDSMMWWCLHILRFFATEIHAQRYQWRRLTSSYSARRLNSTFWEVIMVFDSWFLVLFLTYFFRVEGIWSLFTFYARLRKRTRRSCRWICYDKIQGKMR